MIPEPDYREPTQKEWVWRGKARENVDKWGLQNVDELHDAMTEEILELNHALMHYKHEDPDGEEDASLQDIEDELDDFMALGYQLSECIEGERDGDG